jgi:hypothetical protein
VEEARRGEEPVTHQGRVLILVIGLLVLVAIGVLWTGSRSGRQEPPMPVGVWRFEDADAVVSAMPGVKPSASEAAELRANFEADRLVFHADGVVDQRPNSPWGSAVWSREGDVITVTADRYGDLPGPSRFVLRVVGHRLLHTGWGKAGFMVREPSDY